MAVSEYPGLKTEPQYRSEFLKYMAPLIEIQREKGGQTRPKEIYDVLAERFCLSDEEREETLTSGAI